MHTPSTIARRARGTWSRDIGYKTANLVTVGLTLCTACDSGDKDCGLSTGTLELSIELADDYSESMQDNFNDRMKLVIFHLDEEPETEANCTQFPHEAVLISNHGLDLDDAFEILSGWVCALTDGSYTTIEGEETQTNCYGYLAPVEVPACETVDFPMVVTCEVESYEGN